MPIVGHSTTIKVSGTAVPVTGEATTGLGGGVWQVTSTARRIWDPAAAVTVKDTGVTVAATLWTFDYLFGKVTFSGYSPTGAVTVDGSYLPVAAVAEVKSINVSFGPDLLDRTSFDSAGAKQKLAGLIDGSGSFGFLSMPTADLDTGTVGDQSLASFLANGTAKLLEAKFGSYFMRFWMIPESLEESAAPDALVEGTMNFTLAPQRAGAVLAFGT